MSSYYMKESTYRHDFGQTQQGKDDMRLPLNQERGLNDPRQEGPYTDRRFDRYDDRNGPGPSDRGFDRRPDDRGAYTDRGGYDRRRMEDQYDDRRNDRAMPPERQRFQDPPNRYDEMQKFDKYGNRTTQRDYGDFRNQQRPQVIKAHAYRGEVDKEIDSFHNKVRHRNMEYPYDQQQRLPLNIAPQLDYKSNIQRPGRSESGAYLFIRTQKDAENDIKKSFQKHKSILQMSGILKGIATPDKIKVMGDFTNWRIKQPLQRKGEYWYEQSGSQAGEFTTDYIIVCLWFPSVDTAKKWIHYDVDFKLGYFPDPYGVEILILPINYIPSNDIDCNTFVLTEYPDVLNKEAMKRYIRDPMEDILSRDGKFEKSEPFVVWTEEHKLPRGMMVSPKGVMSCHRFKSFNQARDFYGDPRIERMNRDLKDITKGGRHTTVIFQLVDFV